MNINIIGNGVFGTFLKSILLHVPPPSRPETGYVFPPHGRMTQDPNASTVILAVPISAYEEVARLHAGKHLVNVCSVQEPTTNILLRYSSEVTSIHPLFGPNTPRDRWHAMLTYSSKTPAEDEFLELMRRQMFVFSYDSKHEKITPESHDRTMARVHAPVVELMERAREIVKAAGDVGDMLTPNSFKVLRDFVGTFSDMPPGTLESIKANPYYPWPTKSVLPETPSCS